MLTVHGWTRRPLAAALLVLCAVFGRPALAAEPAESWVLTEVRTARALLRAQALAREAELSPVTVAVLDSGVDSASPDLAGRLWPGINAITGAVDATATPDDSPDGHGTRVAGLIAAATAGFPVKILPVKVLGTDAAGDSGDLARAIRLAADWIGPAGERVRVINLSMGERMRSAPPDLAEAVRYATAQGVVLVAAAGNEGRRVAGYYPAALPGVLSVGALRRDLTPDPASNEGALILAPVAKERSGSSFAAPLVSAGAAVLRSVLPELSWAETMQALLDGHEPRPCPDGRCPVFSMDRALANLGPRRVQPPAPPVLLVWPRQARTGLDRLLYWPAWLTP